jgi:hypothetical protein
MNSLRDAEPAASIETLRQNAGEDFGHMLHNQHRDREVRRQLWQKLFERGRAPRRDTDD